MELRYSVRMRRLKKGAGWLAASGRLLMFTSVLQYYNVRTPYNAEIKGIIIIIFILFYFYFIFGISVILGIHICDIHPLLLFFVL